MKTRRKTEFRVEPHPGNVFAVVAHGVRSGRRLVSKYDAADKARAVAEYLNMCEE